jgi:glucose-induced degradation protein 4
MCPPTPPPEIGEEPVRRVAVIAHKDDGASDGNSAAALALVQDSCLYVTSEGPDEDDDQQPIRMGIRDNEKDKDKVAKEDGLEIDTASKADLTMLDHSIVEAEAISMPTPESVATDGDMADLYCSERFAAPPTPRTELDSTTAEEVPRSRAFAAAEVPDEQHSSGKHKALPMSIDSYTTMHRATDHGGSADLPTTPRFEFTHQRLYPQYPSSFLRPGSKFSGTQQSDRQIYNVDVQILTLSVPESTMTGYLRICGLTEDHPTLTTFFTGEIIGGPNHKHTFQTKDPSWGATDRTDLQHWARFPAWRPLSKDAKRDINFTHPAPAPTPTRPRPGANPPSSSALPPPATTEYDDMEDRADNDDDDAANNPGWWTQPHIFMRWKEWFLVPDHRVKSIQGASFEGFYYICFNQAEGNINGIYFHARSEK